MASIAEANRKIAAIDKRIDAVRAELRRRRPSFDEVDATTVHRAWESYPGLRGIEQSLFARRGYWQEIRDAAEYREAQAAARRERRRLQRADQTRQCPTCGFHTLAAA